MEINLTGENKNKSATVLYSIAQDSYKAKIIEVSEPFMSQGYETEEEIEKVVLTFEVDLEGQKAQIIDNDTKKPTDLAKIPLKLWATTKITKGSGKYSNSKLYDLLERMGLINDLAEVADNIKTSELLSTWLSENLVGKSCKVMVKTNAKGVSWVSDVLRPLG